MGRKKRHSLVILFSSVLILSVCHAVYRSHSRVYTSIQRDPDEGVQWLHCRHFAHMQYNIQQVRIKVQLYLFYLHLGTQSTDLKVSRNLAGSRDPSLHACRKSAKGAANLLQPPVLSRDTC